MPVSAQTYACVALEDPDGQWDLRRGRLREKPAMTVAHNRIGVRVGYQLLRQLDWDEFEVRINAGRVRYGEKTYYVPDVLVVPTRLAQALAERADILEAYAEPLPLIVEVWSPSTGGYDVEEKLPEYRRRGGRGIWRIHPFERSLTAWRRQGDGTYAESISRRGTIEPAALPGVTIDSDALFA